MLVYTLLFFIYSVSERWLNLLWAHYIRSMESAHIPIDVSLVCVLITRINSAQTAVRIWFISLTKVAFGHELQKYHQNRPLCVDVVAESFCSMHFGRKCPVSSHELYIKTFWITSQRE